MAIDKKSIKPILDGQLGSEVAANMKSNFDMLADGINQNESNVDSVKTLLKWAVLGNPPQWLKDALVCYYDPFRQGLRNGDDIKDGRTFLLHDYSPNHLDMTMYNFTGSGVSGMNGFGDNFRKRDIEGRDCIINESTINKISITITGLRNPRLQLNGSYKEAFTWEEHYIKINGLDPEDIVIVNYYNGDVNTKKSINCKGNGIFKIPKSTHIESGNYLLWMNFKVPGNKTFTIEQLPLAEGALVFDGVDDYGLSTGQPNVEGSVISNIESFSYSVQGDVLRLGGQGEPQPLYQFMRFNRVLTEDEIKWVKAKFITTPKLIESTTTEVQP